MLNTRTYTRQELIELFKTDRWDSIKSKLKRRGYTYTTSGRGKDATLTITGLPPRFRDFCIERLGFAPQTDFERLKIFLHKFFFDEEFRNLPIETMAYVLEEEAHISSQTLAHWIEKLKKRNIIWRDIVDFKYYSCRRDKEENPITVPITKEKYNEAWSVYWEGNKNSYCEGVNEMYNLIKGIPRKVGIINENAFYTDVINELEDILREEIDNSEK